MWSRSFTETIDSTCFNSLVTRSSAPLGIASPDGWLCAMIIADALCSSDFCTTGYRKYKHYIPLNIPPPLHLIATQHNPSCTLATTSQPSVKQWSCRWCSTCRQHSNVTALLQLQKLTEYPWWSLISPAFNAFWRIGWCGKTVSTNRAALSVIRLAQQLGQNPRRLQLKATWRSWWQHSQHTRKNPCDKIPHFKYYSNSFWTYLGSMRSCSARCATNAG